MGLCSVCQLCAWGSNSLIGPRKGYTGYECAALHSGDIQYRVVPIISYKITCFSMKTWFYQRNKRCLSVQIVFSMPRFTRTLLHTIFCYVPKMPQKRGPFLMQSNSIKKQKMESFFVQLGYMTFELALPIIIHGGQKWNSSKKTSGIQKRTLTYKSV